MDVVQDFEDILELFARHSVQYLIVGGLAFIYHAKPRYTKDIDLWIDSDHENVRRNPASNPCQVSQSHNSIRLRV